MKATNILEAVAERDIDLLILEEVHSSPEFFSWLVEAVLGEHPTTPRLLGAWHSASDPIYGESDVLLLFSRHPEEKFAFLLENKVDAPAQPGQAERYRERGQKGTVSGEWGDFRTAIFAPRAYLEGNAEAAKYDAQISYETVRDWFRSIEPSSLRATYRAGIIQQAIDQNRRGYSPKVDERVTKFFRDYWLFASREFPELGMPEPGGKPAGSKWAGFRPKGIGKERHLWHKMDVGHVDLELAGTAGSLEELKARYGPRLPADTKLVPAGKSTAFRIRVPILDIFGEFDDQIESARVALKAAYRLLLLWQLIGGSQ